MKDTEIFRSGDTVVILMPVEAARALGSNGLPNGAIQEAAELEDTGTKVHVDALIRAFKADPDYRHTWLCNIAMSIYDETVKGSVGVDHDFCNRAADRFLKLLESQP